MSECADGVIHKHSATICRIGLQGSYILVAGGSPAFTTSEASA